MNASGSPHPLVSVIVPFFEHHSALPDCLTALSRQTYPADRYEVIVIDNSIDAGTLRLSGHESVRIGYEPVPGSYAARNKGISLARGKFLAFTDADCVPRAEWIEKGVARLVSLERPAVVAGHVEVTYRNGAMPNLFEIYDSAVNLRQEAYVEEMHFVATANAFASREVFEEVGPFDARLKSYGDWEWGQRVYQKRIPQVYAREVLVRHPARASFQELLKKSLRKAGGRVDTDAPPRMGFSRTPSDIADEWKRARLYWNLVAMSARAYDRSVALFAPVMLAVTCGRIAERVRLRMGGTSRRA